MSNIPSTNTSFTIDTSLFEKIWTDTSNAARTYIDSSIANTLFCQSMTSITPSCAIPLLCTFVASLAYLAVLPTQPAWIAIASLVGTLAIVYLAVQKFSPTTENNNIVVNDLHREASHSSLSSSDYDSDEEEAIEGPSQESLHSSVSDLIETASADYDSDEDFFDTIEGPTQDISAGSSRTSSPLHSNRIMADIETLVQNKLSSMELFSLLFQMIGNEPPETWEDLSTIESPHTYQLTLTENINKSVSEDSLSFLVGNVTFNLAKVANWMAPLNVKVLAPKTLTIALSREPSLNEGESPYLSLRFPNEKEGFCFEGIPTLGTLDLKEIRYYPNEASPSLSEIVLIIPPLTANIGNIEKAQLFWQNIWRA